MTPTATTPDDSDVLARRELRVPRVAVAISILLGVAFLYNMVLRWAPWPSGFSLNNLTSLEQTRTGSVVSVGLEVGLLVASTMVMRKSHQRSIYAIILPFLLFLLVSPFFRPNSSAEFIRSVAFAVLFSSAMAVAVVFVTLPNFRRLMLWSVAIAVAIGYMLGLIIAVVRPGSVNWGSFRLVGSNDRADFFFFFIPPHFTMAAVALLLVSSNRQVPRVLWMCYGSVYLVILALALRTHTRTYILGLLIFASLIILARLGLRAGLLLVLVSALAIVIAGFLPFVLRELRVDQFGKTGIDATNGRAELAKIVLNSFDKNRAFGVGADAMRLTIEASATKAKTEYGLLGYVGSYGLMSAPVFVTLGLSWGLSSMRIWRRAARRSPVTLLAVVDAANVANFPLSAFWLLGSATAFYDWLALFIAFVALAPMARPTRSHARSVFAGETQRTPSCP